MSRPLVDPESWPVEPAGTGLPAVPAGRLSVTGLRARFAKAQTLVWMPEAREASIAGADVTLRPAAVLIPLALRRTGTTVLLTRRTDQLQHHAGQISFPGGRRDPDDTDAMTTALREAREEIGLAVEHIEVLGTLSDYVTGTGFRVTPVVALVHEPFDVSANASEVAEIFEVPLAFLMDPAHHEVCVFRAKDVERRFFAMPYPVRPASARASSATCASSAHYFIWGATAGMLRNLYRFLSA